MAITVVKSGVWFEWTQDLPPVLADQLRLANGLWNDLVRLHLEHETRVAAIWETFPPVAEALAAQRQLETKVDDYVQTVRDVKAMQRTSKPKHPAVGALREAKAELKAARALTRAAKEVVKDDARALFVAAKEQQFAERKALYPIFVREGGFWATFNDVSQRRFGVALARIGDARAAGRPAELRTRRPDGTGSIAVQLQRSKSQPPRTPDMLADAQAGTWRNVLMLPRIDPQVWASKGRTARRLAGQQVVRMRAGSDAQGKATYLEVPVQIHRQLPPDADITEARLTVRRRGPELVAALTVVAKIPDPVPRDTGPMVALHLGWVETAEGGIQIASWRSGRALDIPPAWSHVMRASPDRTTGTIVVPPTVERRLASADGIRSERDRDLNELKDALAAWIEEHEPLPSPFADTAQEAEPVTAGRVKQWRSPGRFVTLGRHQASLPEWADTDPERLISAWRVRDRDAWRRQERRRANVLGHRDDMLRNVAAVFAKQAHILVVDDMSIADLSRKTEPREDDPNPIPAQALEGVARRRVVGAPGRLREYTVAACKRDGATIVTVAAKNLSLEHTCGFVNEPVRLDPHRKRRCGGCARMYSPDASALVLMFRRAEAELTANDR